VARRSLGWPAFWLTVCAGLAAIVAYELTNGLPLAPTVTAAPPGAPPLEVAARPALPRAPAEDAVGQIAARPLFADTRRPYQPPPEPVAEAPPEPVQPGLPLELAGTYLAGSDRAALLVAGGTPEWLRKGQLIDGWRIEDIAQDQVQLRKGSRQQVLRLRDDLAAPQATRPARPRQKDGDDAARAEPSEADDAPPE
jgi:hypothetical protein